jgi:hypothetical protein
LKVHENGTQGSEPFGTQHNVTTSHVNSKHMGFEVVVTYLETHIFTAPSTFHRAPIGNHDLEIINSMDIAVGFLGDVAMNKVVGAATINQDDDFSVLDITD